MDRSTEQDPGENLEHKERELVRAYLEGATPEQWHLFAARSNYDSNAQPLRWLIDNPALDAATALLIYWSLGAAWYVQYEREDDALNPQTYRLLRLIEERYAAGYYPRAQIWFDPHQAHGGRPDDYPDIPVKRPVPALMLQHVAGSEYVEVEEDPDDFDGGLPFAVVDAIYALYGEA